MRQPLDEPRVLVPSQSTYWAAATGQARGRGEREDGLPAWPTGMESSCIAAKDHLVHNIHTARGRPRTRASRGPRHTHCQQLRIM